MTRLACLLALLTSCTSSSSPVDAAMFPDTRPPDTAPSTCDAPRFPRCAEISGCIDIVPITDPGCEPPKQDGLTVHVCYRTAAVLDVWCVQ